MLSPPDTPAAVDALERIRSSPIAWTAAGLLILGALYFFIRMIEWDLMNQEAENQDDPLQR